MKQGNEKFDHLLQNGDVFRIGDTSGTMVSITFDDGSTDLQNRLPLLLQVIFSGTLFPLTNEGLQLIAMIFPIRWAMAALSSTVGIHGDKTFDPGQSGDKLFGNNYSYHGTLFSTYSLPDATWHLMHHSAPDVGKSNFHDRGKSSV